MKGIRNLFIKKQLTIWRILLASKNTMIKYVSNFYFTTLQNNAIIIIIVIYSIFSIERKFDPLEKIELTFLIQKFIFAQSFSIIKIIDRKIIRLKSRFQSSVLRKRFGNFIVRILFDYFFTYFIITTNKLENYTKKYYTKRICIG